MIGCPCCGDPMKLDLVVCWECFRLSNKLTPGTHPDGWSSVGFTITEEDVKFWEAAQSIRMEIESRRNEND